MARVTQAMADQMVEALVAPAGRAALITVRPGVRQVRVVVTRITATHVLWGVPGGSVDVYATPVEVWRRNGRPFDDVLSVSVS